MHPPQHGIKRTLSKNLLDGFEGTNFHFTTKKGERNRIGREEAREIKMRKMCRCKIRHSEFRSEYAVVRHTVPCSPCLEYLQLFSVLRGGKKERQFALDLSSYLQRTRLEPDIPSIQFLGRITQLRVGKKGRRYRDWEIILFWRKEIDSYESQFRGIIYLGTVGTYSG